MSKLTITISPEAHPILKEWAEKDYRTLTNYITVLLDNLTGVRPRKMYLPVDVITEKDIVPVLTQQFIPHNTPGGILSPENLTGQTHTPTNKI